MESEGVVHGGVECDVEPSSGALWGDYVSADYFVVVLVNCDGGGFCVLVFAIEAVEFYVEDGLLCDCAFEFYDVFGAGEACECSLGVLKCCWQGS